MPNKCPRCGYIGGEDEVLCGYCPVYLEDETGTKVAFHREQDEAENEPYDYIESGDYTRDLIAARIAEESEG